MGSQTITDWRFGMDRRRKRVAGVPGTLWVGKNIHITRGGDVERPKKFDPLYELPAGTFGMGQVRGLLYTFGSIDEPDDMPLNVKYQQLEADDTSATMVEVLDVKSFDGQLYVIARYDNGAIHHFYNGNRVTAWDTVASNAADVNTLASYMADLIDADADVSAVAVENVITITARTAGDDFVISKSTTDGGGNPDQDINLQVVQDNVAEVEEAQATSLCEVIAGSTGTIQDITANGVSLMQAAVSWATSHTATAAAIVVQINNKTGTHGYVAEANGAQFTITAAPGTGDTPNEYVIAATVTGDVVLSTPTMSGGVDVVEPVAKIVTGTFTGTFEAQDKFSVQINSTVYTATGRAAATGTSAFVHKHRVWSPAETLEHYSKIDDATDWTDAGPASGAGFLRMSRESEGGERLVCAAPYGSQMGVFSRNAIHLWNISADAEDNAIAQTLGNTGALSARATLPFGNTDVFYLDEPGVRSLRSKDQSGEAYAADIGNPISPFMRDYMDTLTDAVIRRAVSVIGPEGRYWLALGDYIFVLSYFPESKITAWSYYDPGFAASDMLRIRNKVYVRAEDTIYLYGGSDGATYPDDDEMEAEVSTSFLTAQSPALMKHLTGLDIACTGEWDVKLLVDPNDENKYAAAGKINKTTYNDVRGRIPVPANTTHVALKMTCSQAGPASISMVTLHFDGDAEN